MAVPKLEWNMDVPKNIPNTDYSRVKPPSLKKRINSSSEEVKGMVSFLHEKKFDLFATFTTSKPISLPSTRRLAGKFINRFHAPEETELFWCAEPFDTREGFHFHALIKNGLMYNQDDYFRYWTTGEHYTYTDEDGISFDRKRGKFGRSHFFKINRSKNAEFYLTKYITKKLSDYDFIFKPSLYG